MLIRAFVKFLKDHPGYTLSIYGSGELESELRELSAELGAERAVLFHGNVENIHSEIADAEMFVLSSDYEGLSNALLEAMMMGIPCISTACEGSTDVIRSGENGILVPVGDEGELCRAMCSLADDEKKRKEIAGEGRKTGEGFSKEKVTEKWIEMIERVAAE
jgi:glycosyltransferase involved in cell wall biosynthesis